MIIRSRRSALSLATVVAVMGVQACTRDASTLRCGDSVCAQDEVCDANVCRTACIDDGACDAGQACRGGRCMPVICGDGRVEGVEACDNGIANADSGECTTECRFATCGDGLVFLGHEGCDAGAANSDVAPDACRKSCQLASCGDGVVDSGEVCDAGAANADSGQCTTECRTAVCGDGHVYLGHEACDAGVANSDVVPDACRTSCVLATCGDGVKDSGEACDAGVANSDSAADACRTTCALPRCGDGVQDSGEACDTGAANSDSVADACRTTCVLPSCGDGVKDGTEACDGVDFGGQTCIGLGYSNGDLSCDLGCALVTSGCGPVLVEPFDSCAFNSPNLWGGYDYTFDDSIDSGTSTVAVQTLLAEDVARSSAPSCALEVTGNVTHVAIGGGYIGIGVSLELNDSPVDVSAYSALSLWIRGDGATYSLRLCTASVTDGDCYARNVVAPAAWTQVSIPFTNLQQQGWGTPVTFDPTEAVQIELQTIDGASGAVDVFVDGFGFDP